mmetsp:Transcript_6656/g.23788  ORF Transcript_6656/g.23788 Transcript_6656/m.23788 type:complete len:222 (-) Transcript_6656:2808-3473(-)
MLTLVPPLCSSAWSRAASAVSCASVHAAPSKATSKVTKIMAMPASLFWCESLALISEGLMEPSASKSNSGAPAARRASSFRSNSSLSVRSSSASSPRRKSSSALSTSSFAQSLALRAEYTAAGTHSSSISSARRAIWVAERSSTEDFGGPLGAGRWRAYGHFCCCCCPAAGVAGSGGPTRRTRRTRGAPSGRWRRAPASEGVTVWCCMGRRSCFLVAEATR